MATALDRHPLLDGPPLDDDEIAKIDAYWRAANYLCVGMIYLRDNPLLRVPLLPEHIKETGSFEVTVELFRDVATIVTVEVSAS